MRPVTTGSEWSQTPEFLDQSKKLDAKLKKLSEKQIAHMMRLSDALATKTQTLITDWTDINTRQRAAIDSFLGDIYSGLQVQTWSAEDRLYANEHLRILSGLYGILRPLDGIHPYRLEMGYKLPFDDIGSLYDYWGNSIAKSLPTDSVIINLAAVEYSKVVTKHIHAEQFVTPIFLTISPKTNEPTFVVVHAKIARGAFAAWLVNNRIQNPIQLKEFTELGYTYDATLSTPEKPVFICSSFKGLGLSVRLT